MTESSRPITARGKMLLSTGVLVAAVFAALALAPLASATPDPLASGTTTVTLKKGVVKSLKKAGVKITATKPGKVKGTKATFPVTGGELDPTTGAGTVIHGGGLKIRLGKKSATVSALEISTATKTLSAKLGGKKVKLATLAGISFTRNGFGTNLAAKKLKLTSTAAKALNKALAPKPKKGEGKGPVKKPAPPFKANAVIGSTTSETQPSTVTVLPANSVTFTGDPTLLGKLKDVETNIETIAPTTAAANVFTSPLVSGTISPLGTAGVVNSSGGLKLVQNLAGGPSTTITLGSISVDLAAKTASVEVIATSNAKNAEGKEPLNLGNLGRSSIADITVGGVSADPATRTVAVSATGVLQPVSATVLNGFVQVYEGYYAQVLLAKMIAKSPEEAKALAAAKVAPDQIAPGQALGSFSFTAQTQ